MRVAIAGMGLLGGSLGLALRRTGVGDVRGLCRRPDAAAQALENDAVDSAGTDPVVAMDGTDVLVLCVPIDAMAAVLESCLREASPGLSVTDVGSVKRVVVDQLEPLCARYGARFVGAHPMAGSERSGLDAAADDLFEGATVILTPTAGTDAEALAVVSSLWQSVGGRTIEMGAAAHDAHVARCSHLVHLVAAGLAGAALDDTATVLARREVCGSGFRDTTRVALGSPEMWAEICAANADEIESAFDELERFLGDARSALRSKDREGLRSWLNRAKGARMRFDGPQGRGVVGP